jgi:hypothetical protein
VTLYMFDLIHGQHLLPALFRERTASFTEPRLREVRTVWASSTKSPRRAHSLFCTTSLKQTVQVRIPGWLKASTNSFMGLPMLMGAWVLERFIASARVGNSQCCIPSMA